MRRPRLRLAAHSDVFLAPAENNSSVHLIIIKRKDRKKEDSSLRNDLVPMLEQSGIGYVSN